MADPREPSDEEAAQRADANRAHEIAEAHAPPVARGDVAGANDNKPPSPEEKRALFERYFPVPEPEQDRNHPTPGTQAFSDWLKELGSITPQRDRDEDRQR